METAMALGLKTDGLMIARGSPGNNKTLLATETGIPAFYSLVLTQAD